MALVTCGAAFAAFMWIQQQWCSVTAAVSIVAAALCAALFSLRVRQDRGSRGQAALAVEEEGDTNKGEHQHSRWRLAGPANLC